MDKAPDAFRTISEVAEEINVPQHVLRFWESRFTQIRPLKRGGGRRYYRPDDVDLLRGVRYLLYGEGYTIRGVQRILREEGLAFVQEVWQPGADASLAGAQERDAEEGPGLEEDRPPSEPSLFATEAHESEPPDDSRREPLLVAPAARTGLGDEERRKLQSALDALIACRNLIAAGLGGSAVE